MIYYVPTHVPIEDAYNIFKEKCIDEGIEPPTFEEYKSYSYGRKR